MTAQSWVETTMPPGYSGYAASWSFGIMYGFSTGAVTLERWITEAERNRSAWRHWTAAVLRGRDVRWWHSEGKIGARIGYAWIHTDARRDGTPYVRWRDGVQRFDYMNVTGGRDIDEGMARFAALVLAAKGPP